MPVRWSISAQAGSRTRRWKSGQRRRLLALAPRRSRRPSRLSPQSGIKRTSPSLSTSAALLCTAPIALNPPSSGLDDRGAVKRKDRDVLPSQEGYIFFLVHMSALVTTGGLPYLSFGTWWVVPAMLLHAFVMTNIYTPVHECSHGTPFRTRRLNEAVYRFLSLIHVQTPIYFRYQHAAHHSYTQVRGKGGDPDIVLSNPPKLSEYIIYASEISFWRRNIGWLVRHALSRSHGSGRSLLRSG